MVEAAKKRKRRGEQPAKSIVWADDQALIVRAMVASDDKLLLAGPPSLKPYKSNPMRFANEADALAVSNKMKEFLNL